MVLAVTTVASGCLPVITVVSIFRSTSELGNGHSTFLYAWNSARLESTCLYVSNLPSTRATRPMVVWAATPVAPTF